MGSLPQIKNVPENWEKVGEPAKVNLSDSKSVLAFKLLAKDSLDSGDEDSGFAITSVDGSIVEIQEYLK